jgi:ABC-type sugar transport system ATPase subunit
MRSEIKRLQMELGITSIYVTHDQVEAMTMADRVAVMKDGKLQAYAPPDELYDRPRTLFVASFVGNPPMNLVKVEVVADNGNFRARGGRGFEVPLPPDRAAKAAGRGEVILGIRPDHITVADEGIPAEVYVVEPLGRDNLLDLRAGDVSLRVLADPTLSPKIGSTVLLQLNTEKVQFFDPETEESLLWA